MSAYRLWVLLCDSCGVRKPNPATSVRAARRAAREAGWTYIPGREPRDYCNNCRGGRA